MQNLANKITMLRIFLVPAVVFFILAKLDYGYAVATVIFLLAASTDKVDGYIARKYEQVTNLGKLLDPLADKLLVSSALISLVAVGSLTAWIAIVIITRELAVTGLRSVAAAEGHVIAASSWGKLKTVSQIVAITGVMLLNLIPVRMFGNVVEMLLYVSVFITVLSGVDYFIKADKVLHIRKEL